MEKKSSMVEVQGVPDVLAADRMIDKLHIYFLSTKHGGGEVLKVLYPCFEPGQALIMFEEPEVAARVLRKSSHVLEVNRQQYHLTVKAADYPEIDFPVEATIHLNVFPNATRVREILRSHDFELTDLSGDQVRVKGSFLKLRAAKAFLETLLNSQTETDITPSSSSPVPKVSSGAVSKHYTNSSDGSRSRLGSQTKPPHASASSPNSSSSSNNHPNSPESSSSSSPRRDQRVPLRPGEETFVVDSDVFGYAEQLRRKDIDSILHSHNVGMEVRHVGDNCSITLQGKNARSAVHKLQSLLDELNKSLRTQEVSLKDMSAEGEAVLERVQKHRNIYKSVLVCAKTDKLHLIGPSGESYELKQRLLGRPADRAGRTLDRDPRRRSSSLPPVGRRSSDRDGGANPPPVRAAGLSPSRHRDDRQGGADSPTRNPEQRRLMAAGKNKGLAQLLKCNTKDIKQKLRNLTK